MSLDDLVRLLAGALPYTPNPQQQQVINALARFCSNQVQGESVFMLAGYAGTGKTSLTGALVKVLCAAKVPVVLMAPTGRAAKVLSAHTGMPASTIHKRIYRGDMEMLQSGHAFLQENKLRNALFVVDEASMIGDSGQSGLLTDLLMYVFSGINCKLLLIGDTAQLPPVGADHSPAMNSTLLKSMGLKVWRAVLTDTARQERDSGILHNATWLRRAMLTDPLPKPKIFTKGFDDVHIIHGDDLLETITRLYADSDSDSGADTILITRSNRRATAFNLGIRSEVLDCEEELQRGERLLVAKNNYMYGRRTPGLDFIANGDMAVVTAIHGTEERYGFRFADVNLLLPDRDISLDCKIILDTLTSETASIEPERMQALARARAADPEAYPQGLALSTIGRRIARDDEYYNALQVKYAYAVTCHKSQGAQWTNVIVDLGGIAPENYTLEFYRWFYTATSRATRRLFYLNPSL